jgi:hypothetical protein
MGLTEELAAERTHHNMRLAEQLRYARRLQTLRRARRIERRAEHRLVEAWRRAARLRDRIELADHIF